METLPYFSCMQPILISASKFLSGLFSREGCGGAWHRHTHCLPIVGRVAVSPQQPDPVRMHTGARPHENNSFLKVFLMAVAVFVSSGLRAQAPEQWSSAKILHELQRFNTFGSVLYIAAHPDDENTRLISWLVGEQKLRVSYVSLTRGDGGQNLIGKEQGPMLGLIRTQELLAARRVDGAEQYFTRAYDFGFSKSPDETLNFWHQDSILKDLVALVRRLKPDVMICRFPTTGEGGHGHHTASAILGKLAFEKAADPNYITGDLPAWQTKRIFWNTYSFGTVNTTSEDQISLDAGTYSPLLGASYGEIASLSRSQHKSQGFGTSAQRGEVKEYFIQWGGDTVRKDIFEGLDFSWNRLPEAKQVNALIDSAILSYNATHPAEVVPILLQVKKLMDNVTFDFQQVHSERNTWYQHKKRALDQLILQASGIWMSASVTEPSVVPGDSVQLRFDFIHRYSGKVKLEKVMAADEEWIKDVSPANNQLISQKKQIRLDTSLVYTTPYWLVSGIVDQRFVPEADVFGNAAELNDPPVVYAFFSIDGHSFNAILPVQHRYVDPVAGELFQPLMVLPPVTLQWSEDVMVFPNNISKTVKLNVKAQTANVKGKWELAIPSGWLVETNPSDLKNISLKEKGEVQSFTFILTPQSGAQAVMVSAKCIIDGKVYGMSHKVLEYDHIPRQSVLNKAEIKVVPLDVKMEKKTVGYIPGAGDDIPQALVQLGYQVTEINEGNFDRIKLEELDAIVTGVRAYNNHKWLNDAYPLLMKYVENGGNLLVQYNTNNRLGPLVAKMSPYQLDITRDRVTDEKSEVRFVSADHSVLKYPNALSHQDFEGWIQERGIYFAGARAAEFESIFEMNDPGEKSNDGSTVIAAYGKGHFIYTGLAFFRQLPAGVPGAYKLFVNLLEK